MAKRALWLAAAAAAAVPVAAQAGDAGWYVGAGGGVNWLEDSDVAGTSVEFDLGWLGLIRGGYDYGNGWRTELELGYRDNEVDSIDGVSGGSGDVTQWDAMINVLYEFETGTMFRPYLGVGLGGADVTMDVAFPGGTLDEGDVVFAYQAIAGLGYNITPEIQLFAEGRFLGTDEPDFDSPATGQVEADIWNYSALVGLTYKWLKPKPAPEPPPPEIKRMTEEAPPAPAPVAEEIPRNFIIFFDWDRDNITPEAMAILEEAAEYAKTEGVARVVLTGHADLSGPTDYNQGLSLRRANNARNAMVDLGIPADQIAVFAKGETDPLVPTADGVREPQNRRVEIVLE
jgi:outer membrane protein OmpA-like peptidoglycan-associated protein